MRVIDSDDFEENRVEGQDKVMYNDSEGELTVSNNGNEFTKELDVVVRDCQCDDGDRGYPAEGGMVLYRDDINGTLNVYSVCTNCEDFLEMGADFQFTDDRVTGE